MNDQPTPDTKDWTVVLDATCDQCGIDVRALNASQIAVLVRESATHFCRVLEVPDSRSRPEAATWSAHEYCAHVAEMYTVMNDRLALMLTRTAPVFEDWDQDAAAAQNDYAAMPAEEVAAMLKESASGFADTLQGLRDEQLPRMGSRSNGTVFTTTTLAQYAWHDAAHHLHHDLGVAGS